MQRLGVDLFSLIVVGGAFILSQIRQIPARVRYVIMAVAFGVVAVYRYNLGAQGFNLAVVLIAVGFCVMNLVRAMRFVPPPT